MPAHNESPFDYYLRYVSDEIKLLTELYPSNDQSSAKPGPEVDRYPEIYNEVRMAYSHLARTVLGLDSDSSKLLQTILSTCARRDSIANEGLTYPHATNARDLFDAVIAASDAPYDNKDGVGNLRGSKNHLLRSLMDAKKGQYEMTELLVTDKFNQVLPKGIQNVGAGDLIKRFETHREKGRNEYEVGKLCETLGHHEQGVERYTAAVDAISQSGDLLDSHRENIEVAAKNRTGLHIRIIIKLVFGILFAIIGLLLWALT